MSAILIIVNFSENIFYIIQQDVAVELHAVLFDMVRNEMLS